MKNTIVVAHRGFSSEFPENTILSFQKAIEVKADGIELDLRETKDGEIIVMHDEKLDRTTDGTGFVELFTYEEIRKLDAGKWKGNFKNVKVPSLKEVFEKIGNKITYFIEIKKAKVSEVIKIINDYKMKENVIICSFHIDYLLETKKLSPEIPVALITSSFPENLSYLIKNGINMVNILHTEMDNKRFIQLTKRGILTHVWTVDKKEEMKKYLNMGIPVITTNCPDILLSILKK